MFDRVKRHFRRATIAEKAQAQIEDDRRTLYQLELAMEQQAASVSLIQKRIYRLRELIRSENAPRLTIEEH